MILVNMYYGKNTIEYQAYGTANRVNFLIQKICMGFSFVVLNMTGTLVKKGYNIVIKKLIKLYFLFSIVIVVLSIILFEIIANPFAKLLTNDEKLLELVPTYIRLILISIIPNHIEVSLQSIITGFKKQQILAIISLCTVIIGGLVIGYITIFLLDLGIYGVFVSMFIIETIIGIIAWLFFKRLDL